MDCLRPSGGGAHRQQIAESLEYEVDTGSAEVNCWPSAAGAHRSCHAPALGRQQRLRRWVQDRAATLLQELRQGLASENGHHPAHLRGLLQS